MRASRAWATGISRWRPSHSPTTSSATPDSALLSGARARSGAAKRTLTRPEGRQSAYSAELAGPPRHIWNQAVWTASRSSYTDGRELAALLQQERESGAVATAETRSEWGPPFRQGNKDRFGGAQV